MLQIGAALFFYKKRQTLLQIRAASLLQIGASVVTNWGSCYKLGQLLQIVASVVTNWCSYYKLGKLLQIGAKQSVFVILFLKSVASSFEKSHKLPVASE